MGAPNPFQKLKHGVLLCKKNFRTFVETFNFLVDFAQGIRGDGDGMDDGLIMVDRSIPDKPVIRSKFNYGSLRTVLYRVNSPGRFEIVIEDGSATFLNPFYNVGGRTFELEDSEISFIPSDGIIALKIDITGTSPDAELKTYTGDTALQTIKEEQLDRDHYIIPLYSFKDKEVSIDWRKGPDASMGEFIE